MPYECLDNAGILEYLLPSCSIDLMSYEKELGFKLTQFESCA